MFVAFVTLAHAQYMQVFMYSLTGNSSGSNDDDDGMTAKSLFDSANTGSMSRIVQHTRMSTGTTDRRLARRRLDSTTVSPVVNRPPIS